MSKHSKADKFIQENKDLWEEMAKFGLTMTVRQVNARLELGIPLDDETREETLEKSIPIALKLQKRLILAQGRNPTATDGILEHLNQAKQQGKTYGQIASLINDVLSEGVSMVLASTEVLEPLDPQSDKYLEQLDRYVDSQVVRYLYGIWLCLRSMQIKPNDIHNIVRAGLDRIQDGLPAFDDAFPAVDSERVKKALSYWNKNRRNSIVKSHLK